jgi:hypothetical protein
VSLDLGRHSPADREFPKMMYQFALAGTRAVNAIGKTFSTRSRLFRSLSAASRPADALNGIDEAGLQRLRLGDVDAGADLRAIARDPIEVAGHP